MITCMLIHFVDKCLSKFSTGIYNDLGLTMLHRGSADSATAVSGLSLVLSLLVLRPSWAIWIEQAAEVFCG